MPRFARQFLVASLLTLHAVVMLCGPCLHGLPGLDHAAGLTRGADTDHGADPVKSSHGQADDCLVCHFLAQAQLPVDTACVLVHQHVGAWRVEAPYQSVTPARPHLTSPRAPPASGAALS